MAQAGELIVEIGCGRQPWVANDAITTPILGPADRYVGVDTFGGNRDRLRDIQMQVLSRAIPQGLKEQWSVQMADATDLPFGDHMVDRFLAINFFGDASTRLAHEGAAQEGARVLRYGTGLFEVVEGYSPGKMPLDALRSLLGRYGLMQTNQGSEHDLSQVRRYTDTSRPNAYRATFRLAEAPPEPAEDREIPQPSGIQTIEGNSLVAELGREVSGALDTVHEGGAAIARAVTKYDEAKLALAFAMQESSDTAHLPKGYAQLMRAVDSLGEAIAQIQNATESVATWMSVTGLTVQRPE
jgi:hypothetical protein